MASHLGAALACGSCGGETQARCLSGQSGHPLADPSTPTMFPFCIIRKKKSPFYLFIHALMISVESLSRRIARAGLNA